MKDSVIDFFQDQIDEERMRAKDRLASGMCTTMQEYQYEVTRLRTLEEAVEMLKKAVHTAYNHTNEDN